MATSTLTTTSTNTACLLYPLTEVEEEQTIIPTPISPINTAATDKQEQDKQEQDKQQHLINVVLPPTPSTSDDEKEQKKNELKALKLSRRGTVSLVDLIPVASAALRDKHRLSLYNPPSTQQQESPLARALTKMKIGVTTHRIKTKYLTNEWIRLALAVPLDESTINSNTRVLKCKRTKEIVKWYEFKFKRCDLSLEQLEQRVDELRRQKLLFAAEQPSSPPLIINGRRLSLLVK
jgi:glutaredoxin